MNTSLENAINESFGNDSVTDQFAQFVINKNKEELHILLPSLVLVCVLLVFGLPGNLLAVLVYATKMTPSTVGYFIMSLAISDLINCSISLPVEIAIICHFWSFDIPWLCKFSRFLSAAMNNTSSFILAAIAVERFRSICLPLKQKVSNTKAKVICIVISACAIFSATPMIFCYGTFTHIEHVHNETIELKTCLVDDAVKRTNYPIYNLIYFFVGHIVIFLILATLYSCIIYKLIKGVEIQEGNANLLQRQGSAYSMTSYVAQYNRTIHPTTPLGNSDTNNLSSQQCQLKRTTSTNSTYQMSTTRKKDSQAFRTRRLTCVLVLVTAVFEISFIPYLVVVSIRSHTPDYFSKLTESQQMIYQLFLRSYLINSALNPIIYCFYNQNFRHGVKRFFRSIRESLLESDSFM